MATLDRDASRTRILMTVGPRWIAAFAFACLTLASTACGVKLGADQTTTEIFQSVSVTDSGGGSNLAAGTTLQLHVQYTQPYPAQIDIECDLLAADGSTMVNDIHVAAIPANAAENIPTAIRKKYREEVTPIRGTIEQSFAAPQQPGRYVVNCFTQEDDNNEMERTITIGEAHTPTAGP